MAKKVKASYREEVLRCVIALLDSRGSGTAPPPMPYALPETH